jgi:hypothetical protein
VKSDVCGVLVVNVRVVGLHVPALSEVGVTTVEPEGVPSGVKVTVTATFIVPVVAQLAVTVVATDARSAA